jgi:hypothetical protein
MRGYRDEHARALDQIIDSLTTDINADEIVVEPSPSMHVPAPDLVDTDDDKPDVHDRDTRAATTSQEWLERPRNQVDTGRRSGTVHARSSHVHHPDNYALIKNIIRAAHAVEDDVREQAHAARTLAHQLTKVSSAASTPSMPLPQQTSPPTPYTQSRPCRKFKTSVSCADATSLISKRVSYSTS